MINLEKLLEMNNQEKSGKNRLEDILLQEELNGNLKLF